VNKTCVCISAYFSHLFVYGPLPGNIFTTGSKTVTTTWAIIRGSCMDYAGIRGVVLFVVYFAWANVTKWVLANSISRDK
jgi:hypothetical protein